MRSEKGFIPLLLLLIAILLVSVGWFIFVFFKPQLHLVGKTPDFSPTRTPYPSPIIVGIDQAFSNIPTKPIGQIPFNISGKMVFRRGEELLVANIDGSDEEKLAEGITSNTGGFAGKSQDNHHFYYFVYDNLTQNLFDFDMSTHKSTKIFSSPINDKSLEGWLTSSTVRMSPDGKYFAVTGKDGIYIYTVATGQMRRVLTNDNSCGIKPGGCYGYYRPDWSSDGLRLAVDKILYEGSVTEIVDPFTGTVLSQDLPGGEDTKWSNKGRTLAIFNINYGGGDLYLINDGMGEKLGHYLSEIQLDLKGSQVDHVDWTDDNSIVFSGYSSSGQYFIAMYNTDKKTYKTLQPVFTMSNTTAENLTLKVLSSEGLILQGEKSGLWLVGTDGKSKAQLPTKMDQLFEVF